MADGQTTFKSKVIVGSLVINTSFTAASKVTATNLAGNAVSFGAATHGVVAGNLRAIVASVVTGAANATNLVTHVLGRTPVGFLAIEQDKAGSFYKSRATMATTTHLWVDNETATVTAKLLIF